MDSMMIKDKGPGRTVQLSLGRCLRDQFDHPLERDRILRFVPKKVKIKAWRM